MGSESIRGAQVSQETSLMGDEWGPQIREIRIGMAGDSVLCWGEWWDITCSTTVCLDMCFIRYVSWKKTHKWKKTNAFRHLCCSWFTSQNGTRLGSPTHWGVRPAAHTAAVGLGVFDGVCRHVDLQRGRVWIGTVTVGTFEGLVFVVLPLVRLQQDKQNAHKLSQIHAALWKSLVEDWVGRTGVGGKQSIFTCRLESWVKAFSHPGCAHLYGRSPVWILKLKKIKRTLAN